MMQRQRFRQTKGLLALFLALAGLPSCVYDKYDPSLCPQSIHLPLSLYISPTQEPSQTKMSDEVTQAQNQFRGMDFIRVLPFKAPGGAVQAADEIWGNSFAMELVGAGSVHIYDDSFFLTQANAVLIYGRAAAQGIPVSQADSLAFKRRNGSLLMPDFLQVKKAGEAGFRPEPYLNRWMQENRYNTWRQNLVNYLNGILKSNVKYNGVTREFRNPADYGNHPGLKAALEAFTNYGILFSGSQEVLDGRLTALYRAVYPLAESAHNSIDYHDGTYYYVYQLAKVIVRSMNNTSRVSISGSGTNATVQLNEQAPASFGLPAGAYVLQYREGSRLFYDQLDNKNNGSDHRVGLYTTDERYFAYPPSLCYWTASLLLTSEEKDVKSYYDGNHSWESVLEEHYPGHEVQSKTRSAAVKEPLSIGVSRLLLRLQRPSSLTLDDSAGNLFRIDNSSFPLTGILVAGQRKVIPLPPYPELLNTSYMMRRCMTEILILPGPI